MDLSFEKGELSKRLLQFGLGEKQLAALMAEFERRSFSMSGKEFAQLLIRLGHPRAAVLSLLRELGASEKDLLGLFSSLGADGPSEVLLSLVPPKGKTKAKRKRWRAKRN